MCTPVRYGQKFRHISTETGFDIYCADGFSQFEVFWTRQDYNSESVFGLIKLWAMKHGMSPVRVEGKHGLNFEMRPNGYGPDAIVTSIAKLLTVVPRLEEILDQKQLVFS